MPHVRTAAVALGGGHRGVLGELLAGLARFWREREPYQTVTYVVGTLLIVSGLIHLGVFLIDGGPWQGPVSWRKPVTFGVSFGLTTITLGWMAGVLGLPRRVARPLLLLLAGATTLEVLWVTSQRYRGVPSHFNFDTSYDAVVFLLGGVAILVVFGVVVTLAAFAFRRGSPDPAMTLAIRVGLVVLVVAQIVGGFMISRGIASTEADGAEVASTTVDPEGSAKVPHAAAMHGIQTLPGLAWLVTFSTHRRRRRRDIVATASAGYAGLVAVSILQTLAGRAPWDLTLVSGVLLAASVAALLGALGVTVLALRAGRGRDGPLHPRA